MTFALYLLPDNRIVKINSEIARGQFFLDFTLENGKIVQAMRFDCGGKS